MWSAAAIANEAGDTTDLLAHAGFGLPLLCLQCNVVCCAQVWNWQFEVAGYNLHMANASVLVHGDPNHLNYDNASNAGYWAWRRTAYMCKHAADLFKTVFGDENVGRGKVSALAANWCNNTRTAPCTPHPHAKKP